MITYVASGEIEMWLCFQAVEAAVVAAGMSGGEVVGKIEGFWGLVTSLRKSFLLDCACAIHYSYLFGVESLLCLNFSAGILWIR